MMSIRNFLVALLCLAIGYLAGIETTVSDVMGRPARRFADFVAENRDAFVK